VKTLILVNIFTRKERIDVNQFMQDGDMVRYGILTSGEDVAMFLPLSKEPYTLIDAKKRASLGRRSGYLTENRDKRKSNK
jgi:hypothetical protein